MLKYELAKNLVEQSVLKRSAIAAECGVETQTLTAYLNGFRNPSKAVALHLARVLKVDLDTLWTETETGQKAANTITRTT